MNRRAITAHLLGIAGLALLIAAWLADLDQLIIWAAAAYAWAFATAAPALRIPLVTYRWSLTVNGQIVASGTCRTADEMTRNLAAARAEHLPPGGTA